MGILVVPGVSSAQTAHVQYLMNQNEYLKLQIKALTERIEQLEIKVSGATIPSKENKCQITKDSIPAIADKLTELQEKFSKDIQAIEKQMKGKSTREKQIAKSPTQKSYATEVTSLQEADKSARAGILLYCD